MRCRPHAVMLVVEDADAELAALVEPSPGNARRLPSTGATPPPSAPVVPPPCSGWHVSWSIVGFAAAVYGAVRAVTEGSVAQAVANAEAVERLERTLGIGWEQSVQSLVHRQRRARPARQLDLHLGPLARDRRRRHVPVREQAGPLPRVAERDHHLRADRIHLLLRDPDGAAAARRDRARGHRAPAIPRLPCAAATLADQPVRGDAEPPLRLEPPRRDRDLRGLHVALPCACSPIAMPLAMGFAVVATANHFVLDIAVSVVVVASGSPSPSRWNGTGAGGGREPAARNPNNRVLRARLH